MKINVPENAYSMFFFELMLTDNLVEDLMKKTKKYANKTISRNCLFCCRSMWNSWAEVTIDEMRKFIELISSMGILSMSSYKKY